MSQPVTMSGSGSKTMIPTDPAVSGGRISPDPAVALAGGLKKIPEDPATADAQKANIKVG